MTIDVREAAARVVIADVHRTTTVRLTYAPAPWIDSRPIAPEHALDHGVVHLADRPPSMQPHMPTGTSSDFHEVIFAGPRVYPVWWPETFDDVVGSLADDVSSLVQVARWSRGLDPSWPPCPEHAGRHPLRAVVEDLEDRNRDRVTVPQSATWRCYQPIVHDDGEEVAWGPTAIPIGRLAIIDGVAAIEPT